VSRAEGGRDVDVDPDLAVVDLDATRLDAWATLFDACGCACFCRWWHFEGTKNEWLARCAGGPEANRAEQRALVEAGDTRARGLLAMRGATALGWMKLVPRASVPKLRGWGVYRGMDLGDDAGVWSIGCLLVRPGERRRGVARALVRAAPSRVAAWGGRVVEAYPRDAPDPPEEPLHDEQAWMGTTRLFASCGFVEVAAEGPYRVLRAAAV
jgi:GNAT superfamily N-acetyltransferase